MKIWSGVWLGILGLWLLIGCNSRPKDNTVEVDTGTSGAQQYQLVVFYSNL